MKKYLLLASVAGCLLSANAMAATFSENTATITAEAILESYVSISNASDMSFGTLVVDSTHKPTSMTKIASIDKDGTVTREDSDFVVTTGGAPAAGSIEMENYGVWEEKGKNYSITCGAGAYNTNGCELSNGGDSKLYLQNIGIQENGSSGTYCFSADLYADANTTDFDYGRHSGTFTITLSY